MFSSCRCCRMLSICSAETSTGAKASMTSSLVRKPRSLPLATRSRTSSICASLAIAICSGTSRSVRREVGAPHTHLGGALGEIPVASGPRLPQGSPSGLEGDELFEDSSVPNAAAANTGDKPIRLSARPTAAGQAVFLIVADEGVGMDESTLQQA